ncbi:MAG: hypothetical protein ACI4JW_01675 [Oscillospiraceae bacterium]
MDTLRFAEACSSARKNSSGGGIGTLGEKTVHAVLKLYLEPHCDNHEVKVGRYVADIVGENGVIEIQTANFGKMRKKLFAMLENTDVTIAYPVAAVKYLIWLDAETGEMTKPRRSPKQSGRYEIFRELVYILPLLDSPRLHFKILLMEVDEYRIKDGWSEDGKKGSHRFDRIPKALIDEIDIERKEDFDKLIPAELNEQFTIKEFSKAAKITYTTAQRAVKTLCCVGRIVPDGKRGREKLYTKA